MTRVRGAMTTAKCSAAASFDRCDDGDAEPRAGALHVGDLPAADIALRRKSRRMGRIISRNMQREV